MRGKDLIKSVSAQPRVKCLHLTSISLAHLCCFAARLIVPTQALCLLCQMTQTHARLVVGGEATLHSRLPLFFFPTNEVSAVMFAEVDPSVIINARFMGEMKKTERERVRERESARERRECVFQRIGKNNNCVDLLKSRTRTHTFQAVLALLCSCECDS